MWHNPLPQFLSGLSKKRLLLTGVSVKAWRWPTESASLISSIVRPFPRRKKPLKIFSSRSNNSRPPHSTWVFFPPTKQLWMLSTTHNRTILSRSVHSVTQWMEPIVRFQSASATMGAPPPGSAIQFTVHKWTKLIRFSESNNKFLQNRQLCVAPAWNWRFSDDCSEFCSRPVNAIYRRRKELNATKLNENELNQTHISMKCSQIK